jgi:hypothetical protein
MKRDREKNDKYRRSIKKRKERELRKERRIDKEEGYKGWRAKKNMRKVTSSLSFPDVSTVFPYLNQRVMHHK